MSANYTKLALSLFSELSFQMRPICSIRMDPNNPSSSTRRDDPGIEVRVHLWIIYICHANQVIKGIRHERPKMVPSGVFDTHNRHTILFCDVRDIAKG